MRDQNYLPVEEEIELYHYHFEMPRHAYYFFAFWTFWILATFYSLHSSSYTNGMVPWDNCDPNITWQPEMRSFINKNQYESELRKILVFRENNKQARMNNFTRIDYGTSELIYCKEDQPLICDRAHKIAMPRVGAGNQIKSILRSIEFDPYFSSSLRFVVLHTMIFRMVLCVFRTSDVLLSRRDPLPFLAQLLFSITPYLSALQSISMFWITALHTQIDQSIGKWHPYAYVSVGITTTLEMFIDLLLDAIDSRHVLIKTPKFYIKSLFFLGFCYAYPHVFLNWIAFFTQKTCHPYVPLFDGLLEYLCALSICVFQFINSLIAVQMYITPTMADTQNVCTQVYTPLGGGKCAKYESLKIAKT